MKAMLLAAGLGTRLKPFTDNHPKALAEVAGKTLLELSLRYLQRHGISEVIVNVHHFADQIEAVLAQHNGFGSRVTVSDERSEVLETGGGIQKAGPYFKAEPAFLVMNVDVLTNLDLHQLIAAHEKEQPLATLAVMQRSSSRQLLFDENMQLCGWQNNGTGQQKLSRPEAATTPFAFTGIQVISQQLLQSMTRAGKFSMIDVYLEAAVSGAVMGHDHTGDQFIDVGKPDSLRQAAQLFPELDRPGQ